jgi:hypothetical protein
MLRDMLDLKGVQVVRKMLSHDGMGGMTTTTTVSTLAHNASIWSPGQSQRYISDRMFRASTHVLVTNPADYTFTVNDTEVIYNAVTYKITGPSDDVAFKGEIIITGLERLQ